MGSTRLGVHQLRSINRVLLELYEETATASPLEMIVDHIAQLAPSTWFAADIAYPGTDRIEHQMGRNVDFVRNAREAVALYGHQNPVVSHLQRVGFAPALRLSEFTTFRQFRQTAFYTELMQQLTGFRDQLGVMVRLPGAYLGFSLNRETRFTDEEELMMEILQPHLERVLFRSTQYAQLPANPPLTPREREILHWVAEGKRDAEISLILRIAERTINQHVRAILRKLGVETRTGAAAVCWRSRLRSKEVPGQNGF